MSFNEELERLRIESRREVEKRAAARQGIDSLKERLSSGPGFLRDELLHKLYFARSEGQSWVRSLEEVRKNSYSHKEDYHEQMVLKYASLEVQALCGLATLSLQQKDGQ